MTLFMGRERLPRSLSPIWRRATPISMRFFLLRQHILQLTDHFLRFLADPPGFTDLGVWNMFANPDHPNPQEKIEEVLTRLHGELPKNELLTKTIAAFKTAGLRDLGQSAPYLHTGGKDTLSDVIQFYIDMSELVRTGQVRNPDSEIGRIRLTPDDIAPLRSFLRSLNEDYS